MSFGTTLARLRRSRGLSQEALALRAGLSQRHVSFLETGRAAPGHKSLHRLVSALALRGWEQRSLIEAMAPAAVSPRAAAAAIDMALAAQLCETMTCWPAYAYRPDGTLVHANAAMARLLAAAAPGENLWQATAPAPAAPNIYDLALHPGGLMRWMANPQEVVPETLRRLRVEAAGDAALAGVIARLEAYPAARAHANPAALPPAVLVERYRLGELDEIAVISLVSHLASPGEFELAGLRIESFVPADEASAALLGGG
jgi:transcriptional regulator with XRE-family HTH domain